MNPMHQARHVWTRRGFKTFVKPVLPNILLTILELDKLLKTCCPLWLSANFRNQTFSKCCWEHHMQFIPYRFTREYEVFSNCLSNLIWVCMHWPGLVSGRLYSWIGEDEVTPSHNVECKNLLRSLLEANRSAFFPFQQEIVQTFRSLKTGLSSLIPPLYICWERNKFPAILEQPSILVVNYLKSSLQSVPTKILSTKLYE